jgi:hypothetical protein
MAISTKLFGAVTSVSRLQVVTAACATGVYADSTYLIEEHGREPWVLPENALSDASFKLYDSRYSTSDPKKCWEMLLLVCSSSGL